MNDTRSPDSAKQCRGKCDLQWLTHDDPLCPLYEGDEPAAGGPEVDEDLLPRRQRTPSKLPAA